MLLVIFFFSDDVWCYLWLELPSLSIDQDLCLLIGPAWKELILSLYLLTVKDPASERVCLENIKTVDYMLNIVCCNTTPWHVVLFTFIRKLFKDLSFVDQTQHGQVNHQNKDDTGKSFCNASKVIAWSDYVQLQKHY